MTTLTVDQARSVLDRAAADPVWWEQDVLGCDSLYSKQIEIAEAVRDEPQVAVLGCNGSGKDYQAGRLLLWWLSTHHPAKAVVIGPTTRQVTDIVWREARTAFNQSRFPLGGQMAQHSPRWELGDDSYGLGFSTDDPYNIQGFHSPNLLVIITEAHNVPQPHIDAVKRLSPKRLLLTGNPFADSGEFYEAFFSKAHLYRTIEISAFDTPNVIEKREVTPGMITYQDVLNRREEWGEDSPMYIASVLGRFPDNLEDAIVTRRDARAAVERELEPTGPASLACDVARFGADRTVVYWRQGNVARLVWKVQGRDTQQVAGKLGLLAQEDPDVKTIIVDDTGVGGGVVDRLRESPPRGVSIVAFNGGSQAEDKDRYVNAIAEAWLEVGRAFKDGAIDIDDNAEALGQLTSRRYTIQGDRRLKLEGKEDYKKRAGRSPDDADALAMAWSPNERPNLRWL